MQETQPESPPASAPATQADQNSDAEVRQIKPFDDITVRLQGKENAVVEIEAWTSLDSGLLEQVACAPQTREHESLLLIRAKPSQIHAALLMAGFEPGSPGKWTYQNERIQTMPPKGEQLAIAVRYPDPKDPSITLEKDIREWIRPSADSADDPRASKRFPNRPWVFAGSAIVANPSHMGPGEHYVADMSGSIIGLVTFGDELIGFSEVLSDQESVQSLIWEVNSDAVPPPNTPVTVVVKKWKKPAEPE